MSPDETLEHPLSPEAESVVDVTGLEGVQDADDVEDVTEDQGGDHRVALAIGGIAVAAALVGGLVALVLSYAG